MTSYSMANSLSPMMFRKSKVKNGGTANERKRSRSLENILDESVVANGGRSRRGTALPAMNTERSEWSEIPLVKSTAPVVTCLLPALSMDMVCSALLAVGATPLITEGSHLHEYRQIVVNNICSASWRSHALHT